MRLKLKVGRSTSNTRLETNENLEFKNIISKSNKGTVTLRRPSLLFLRLLSRLKVFKREIFKYGSAAVKGFHILQYDCGHKKLTTYTIVTSRTQTLNSSTCISGSKSVC